MGSIDLWEISLLSNKSFIEGIQFRRFVLITIISLLNSNLPKYHNLLLKRTRQLGQQDDRIALIDAGREQVLLAMTMTDKHEKKKCLE